MAKTTDVRRTSAVKKETQKQIEIDEQGRRTILTPVTRDFIHSLRGKYKGRGLLKALMAEKNREMEM
ncbi:MAG: hypothetical protein AAB217_26165 [Chloroflexota bacterium]